MVLSTDYQNWLALSRGFYTPRRKYIDTKKGGVPSWIPLLWGEFVTTPLYLCVYTEEL